MTRWAGILCAVAGLSAIVGCGDEGDGGSPEQAAGGAGGSIGGTNGSGASGGALAGSGGASAGGGSGGAASGGAASGGSGGAPPTCQSDCPDLDFVQFPGGSFQMGKSGVFTRYEPVHPVSVRAFSLMRAEVTADQYAACVAAGGCTAPRSTGDAAESWEGGGVKAGRGSHPINAIDWNQARTFCAWAGARLPTEAEWEYAARGGGQDRDYPWGAAEPTCDLAVVAVERSAGCGQRTPAAVCSRTQGNTPQGLCDMSGNVAEFVEDDFHEGYTGAPSDGSAWLSSPRSDQRVSRGGEFTTQDTEYLSTWTRSSVFAVLQDTPFGVRCAK